MISLADISRHVWACDPSYVELFIDDLAALDSSEISAPKDGDRAPPPYTVRDGVAHIEINGMIMRNVPPIVHAAGIPATSTTEAAITIREALADDQVNSIMLDIDSPGGTLAGTAELADLIHAGKNTKPISAHAQDLAASAAYWIGSQADRFTASQTAQIGSIGVYRVMIDTSEAAAKAGARVHVVRSGDHKGAGAPGAPISAEDLKVEQSIIDRAAGLFSDAVKRGRGLEETEVVTSGRTWLADDAKDLGLVDAVETSEAAHIAAQGAVKTDTAQNQAAPLPVAAVDEKFNPKGAAIAAINKAIAASGFDPLAACAGQTQIARVYDPADPENVKPKNGRLTVFWPRLVQAAHALNAPNCPLSDDQRADAYDAIAGYFAAYGKAPPPLALELDGAEFEAQKMPFENEHDAIQTDPGKYKKFRRKKMKSNREPPEGGIGGPFPTSGITFIIGVKGPNSSEVQSVRALASVWNVKTFKDWLVNNGFKNEVDPATGKKQKEKQTMSDQETISNDQELEKLKAELEAAQARAAKAEAHAEAAVTSLTDVRSGQKIAAIEAAVNAGRVTPAMRASVEAYAEKCGDNVEELAEFLAALPTQTKPDPIGNDQEQKIETSSNDGAAVVAQFFNRSAAEVESLGQIRAVTCDGMAITQNGDRVRLSEIIKGV
ncbi:MAG: hypothetical protein CMJ20_02595 [Phycisphaeraceae bacterium]|nr:hypothetical protein [Phycisphaeraceae bacterium]